MKGKAKKEKVKAKGWEKEKDPQNNRMQTRNTINNEHDVQVTGFQYINENLITMAKNNSTICMDVCKVTNEFSDSFPQIQRWVAFLEDALRPPPR